MYGLGLTDVYVWDVKSGHMDSWIYFPNNLFNPLVNISVGSLPLRTCRKEKFMLSVKIRLQEVKKDRWALYHGFTEFVKDGPMFVKDGPITLTYTDYGI